MAARKISALIILDGRGYLADGASNAIGTAITAVGDKMRAIAPPLIQPEQPAEMTGTPLLTPA